MAEHREVAKPAEDPLARLKPSHRRLVERIRKMTPEELFQSLVASGIYTPDGKLTPEYGGQR